MLPHNHQDKMIMKKTGKPLIDIEYGDTPELRCIDLKADGLPCVPVLGRTRFLAQHESDGEHVHPGCVEIVYCIRGDDLAFEAGGKRYQFLPGHVFVSRPEEPHHLVSIPKGIFLYWCLFELPSRDGTVLGLGVRESRWLAQSLLELPRRHFEGTEAMRRLFNQLLELHDSTSQPSFVKKLLMRNAMFNLLMETVSASKTNPVVRSNRRLQRIVEDMRSDPGRDYSLAELATMSGLSPTSLNTSFKKMMGLPPHAFLLKCRIERAKIELAKPGCRIGALAEELGFRSFRHFSAQFKAVTGCLPSKWPT